MTQLRFETITIASAFQRLRAQWDALLARVPHASPFMSWAWQWHWWSHYGAGHALNVVTVWKPGTGSRCAEELLVAVWPLQVRRQPLLRGNLRLRVLLPIGVGGDTTPDYLDPLVDPEYAAVLAPRLAQYVLDEIPDWDELGISDLRAGLPFADALSATCLERGLPTQVDVTTQLCYVPLPPTWEAYLASLSGDRRQKLRWMRKKFMELPGARFYVLADKVHLDAVINRLIDLHHQRWEGRGSHAFSSPAYCGFHRALMHDFWTTGWLRLYCLEAEGKIVAIFYCYALGGVVYHMQTGFDPAWSKWSPGHVMIGCLVEDAIREGAHGLDMLAGENAFKRTYARESSSTVAVTAARGLMSRLVFGARRLRARLRARPAQPATPGD